MFSSDEVKEKKSSWFGQRTGPGAFRRTAPAQARATVGSVFRPHQHNSLQGPGRAGQSGPRSRRIPT